MSSADGGAPAQQLAIGAGRPSTAGLRAWQQAFLERHAAAAGRDFLLVATPGAGKTLAACHAARADAAEQVIVVCPTVALRAQWADAADLVGLHLDPRWRNADGAWRPELAGVAVTYQQVASAPDLFAHHLRRPTFVILDEIHHAGDQATWGTALQAAFGAASRRLALSGTPFRSDARAIPFVAYDEERRCAPDYVYGYGDAVTDDVCRPLAFRLLDATLRWRVDEQQTIAAFADELDQQDDARRLRTAIDPATPLLPQMLREADVLLCKVREVVADAAGLVLCDDRTHARAVGKLLRTITGEKPVVVVSDEAGAHARIERFARGGDDAPRWLVAVNMVSEGVDVPRLIVAVYATVKRTELFFRQAVGRIVRRRVKDAGDLLATVLMPADPTLKALAERVEIELRQQVSDDLGAAYDVEPPPGFGRRADFEALGADVQAGGIIIAGVHYTHDEVLAGRRLLRDLGQPERALRAVLEFVRRERVASRAEPPHGPGVGGAPVAGAGDAPGATSIAPVPAHRRIEAKRRALDRLARRWAQLRRVIDPAYTWPMAQARVNSAMGVPRRAAAGEAQLDDGLAFLRSELEKLSRTYPVQAERLRITASVEAIDSGLLTATGEPVPTAGPIRPS
ncbi:MAG: DEAD/DEAH box helicase [Solirubrobacteraceae bacterium]|jgi:superfamily II DNA or RNA helicase